MTLVLPSLYLSFSVTVSRLNEECKLSRAQDCISGFFYPLCTTMRAAGRLLRLLNEIQIKHLPSNFATLLIFFFLQERKKPSSVDISKKLCAHRSKS